MSPLVFPDHLSSIHEKDMGPRKSGPELERLIALRPVAVVMYDPGWVPPDPVAFRHLLDYVHTRCRPPVRATTYLYQGITMNHLVYAGCGSSPEGNGADRAGAGGDAL
jgi:hypothetical protein